MRTLDDLGELYHTFYPTFISRDCNPSFVNYNVVFVASVMGLFALVTFNATLAPRERAVASKISMVVLTAPQVPPPAVHCSCGWLPGAALDTALAFWQNFVHLLAQ